ncbi:MAG TPA: MFS transporter [Burkholderiales bacterium]|nr:MFS transporter [Burkholderiales bacterium]
MTLYLIIFLAFLTHLGFAGSRLAVPLLAVDQGATPFVVGTVMSLYAALPAVLALPAGRLLDRLGFQLPLVFGSVGLVTALLLPFLWPSVTTLYFASTLLGLCFMIFQLATQTLTGAIAAPAERARNFAHLSLGYAVANFSGPLIAGVLIDHAGHAWTFFALAMPLVPVVVVTAMGSRWIPDVHAKSESARGGFLDLLRIRELRQTLIASGIVSSAWDVYQFVMPIYGRSLGLTATAIGAVMSAFAVSIILVRLVLPLAVRRTGEAQMLTYAMYVACAAFLLFPLFHSPWLLAAVSFLLGAGCGVGQPLSLTMVYNASPRGRAGEAAGMRVTVNQVTHFMIPLLFGAMGSAAGYAAVFVVNAGCLAVGGWVSRRYHAAKE